MLGDGTRPLWRRLGMAVLITAAAALLRHGLLAELGRGAPYIAFYPAVMLAALYGGWTAGLLTTALSTGLAYAWVLQRHLSSAEWISLAVFTLSSILVTALSEALHRANQNLHTAAAARHESEARYQAVLTNLHDAVLLTSPDGRVLSANPAACRLFGRTEAELCALGRTGLVEMSDPRLGPLLIERSRTGCARGTLTMQRVDGTRFEGELASSIFTDASGQICASMVIRDLTTQLRATAQLKQAAQEWQTTFDATRDAVWVLDRDCRILRANRTAELSFARPAAEMIGRPCWEIAHGTPAPIPECPLRRAALSLKRETADLARNGRWYEIIVDPILDDAGRFAGAVHSLSDITDRRLAEQERNLLADAIGASLDEIVIFDAATLCFRYANTAAITNLGYTFEELRALSPLDIKPDLTTESLAALLEPLRRGEKRLQVFETAHRRADGSRYLVEAHLQLLPQAGHPVFLSVANDITVRRQLEAALRESQEHYRLIAENTADIVWLFDLATMRFVYVSPSVESMRGFTREEAAAQPLEATLTPESCRFVHENLQQRLAAFAAGDESARTRTYEFSLLHKAGHSVPAEVVTTILPGADGRPSRVVGITRDLTERRRAEQALRESEEKFSKIFHNAPALIAITDLETGHYLDLNDQVAKAAGYARKQMLGHSSVELGWFSPEQRARLVAEIRAHGRVQNLEILLQPRHGPPLVGLTSGETITLAGRPCLLTVTTDITDRKRHETELRAALEESQRFRRALDQVDAFVYIKDTASRYLYANAPTLRMFGCDAASLAGCDDARFFPPATVQRLHEVDAQVFRGENTAEEIAVPAGAGDPKFYWEIKTPLFGSDGRTVVGLLGISTDITARKATEAELRTHTAHLQSLLRIAEHREETEQEFLDRALAESLAITDSRFGYIYHYDEEQQRFILNTWSKDVMASCRVADPRTCYELELTGIWGEAVRQRRPILLNDFAATHPLKKGYPEGHVALTRFLTIPVFEGERIVAVVGVANKATDYGEPDILQLQLLMGSVWHTLGRRRAEDHIRGQYLILRGLLESFDTPVFSLDAELRYTSFNRLHAEGMRALYGVEIALGQSLLDYQTPEDRAAAESNFRHVLAGAHLQIDTFSGAGAARRFFEINHTPIRDAAGATCGIAILARDLTQRKQAEESLAEAGRFASATIDALTAHLCVIDQSGTILTTNRAWREFAAANPPTTDSVLPGSNYLAVCDAATGPEAAEAHSLATGLREVMHGARDHFALEYACHSPTEQRWFIARVTRFPGTGSVRLVVTHENITARVHAEEALTAANARLERTVQERTAALLAANRFLDRTGEIARVGGWEIELAAQRITWSGATRSIHEVPSDYEPTIATAVEFYAPESRPIIAAAVQAAITTGTPFDFELAFVTARGRRLWVRASGEAFREEDQVAKIGGTFQDITARRQAEDELRLQRDQLEQLLAERTAANERLREVDRLKSEFLSTMSHELRTPLNSIVGFTGILIKGLAGPLNPEQHKQLGLVQSSGRHLLALINDLLDLSRIESGRMELQHEEFDFAAVVEEVVASLRPTAEQKLIELTARCTPASIRLVGDRRRTFQILLNLANNAVKFTERGGVAIAAHTAAGRLVVAVRDTGIGIRPDQLPLLFEAFRQLDASHRRHYEGTGLGLHLCKKLLGLLGGEIAVASVPGTGSTFTFTLPHGP